MTGQFIISLDFELLWGVRDHADRNSYGRNVLGAREAVPQMLELFAHNGIQATWATVGFLFCETRDELIETSRPKTYGPAMPTPPCRTTVIFLTWVGTNPTIPTRSRLP